MLDEFCPFATEFWVKEVIAAEQEIIENAKKRIASLQTVIT